MKPRGLWSTLRPLLTTSLKEEATKQEWDYTNERDSNIGWRGVGPHWIKSPTTNIINDRVIVNKEGVVANKEGEI